MKFRIILNIKTEKSLDEIFDELRMKDFDLQKADIRKVNVEEIK